MNIVIADDDESILESLDIALSGEHNIRTCLNLSDLGSRISELNPDLLICDYDFGHANLEHFLDSHSLQIPIIVLTGTANRQNIIDLLNRGISGFLEKPVQIQALKNRIRAIKEVSIARLTPEAKFLRDLGIELSQARRDVKLNGERISLTPIEFKILNFICARAESEFSRSELQNFLWPGVHVAHNTLDTHIGNLKKKIPVLKERLLSEYGGVLVLKADL